MSAREVRGPAATPPASVSQAGAARPAEYKAPIHPDALSSAGRGELPGPQGGIWECITSLFLSCYECIAALLSSFMPAPQAEPQPRREEPAAAAPAAPAVPADAVATPAQRADKFAWLKSVGTFGHSRVYAEKRQWAKEVQERLSAEAWEGGGRAYVEAQMQECDPYQIPELTSTDVAFASRFVGLKGHAYLDGRPAYTEKGEWKRELQKLLHPQAWAAGARAFVEKSPRLTHREGVTNQQIFDALEMFDEHFVEGVRAWANNVQVLVGYPAQYAQFNRNHGEWIKSGSADDRIVQEFNRVKGNAEALNRILEQAQKYECDPKALVIRDVKPSAGAAAAPDAPLEKKEKIFRQVTLSDYPQVRAFCDLPADLKIDEWKREAMKLHPEVWAVGAMACYGHLTDQGKIGIKTSQDLFDSISVIDIHFFTAGVKAWCEVWLNQDRYVKSKEMFADRIAALPPEDAADRKGEPLSFPDSPEAFNDMAARGARNLIRSHEKNLAENKAAVQRFGCDPKTLVVKAPV
ncbi:MAG: hypothetical protein HYX48_04605 [Chlamydiales bacterium]|nr:hypothetical protein [Chlamydiales bacterium]